MLKKILLLNLRILQLDKYIMFLRYTFKNIKIHSNKIIKLKYNTITLEKVIHG